MITVLKTSDTTGKPVKTLKLKSTNMKPIDKQAYFNEMFPDLPESEGEWDNAIQERHVIIVGDISNGKTNTTRWIITDGLKKKYGAQNVNVQVEKAKFFDRMFIPQAWTPQPVQCKVVEDVTLSGLKDGQLAPFFTIRDYMAKYSHRRTGLCIVIFTSHGFYSAPKEVRENYDSIIYLIVPVNPYDKRDTKRMIGKSGVNFLLNAEITHDKGAAVIIYRHEEFGILGTFHVPKINWEGQPLPPLVGASR